MRVKIDEFGRVLIPKRIRDHLGLAPGITIELEEKGGEKLVMRVMHEKQSLEIQDGVLVFRGTPLKDIDETIKEMRDERLHKFSGDLE